VEGWYGLLVYCLRTEPTLRLPMENLIHRSVLSSTRALAVDEVRTRNWIYLLVERRRVSVFFKIWRIVLSQIFDGVWRLWA
jgi:hypothetical protein